MVCRHQPLIKQLRARTDVSPRAQMDDNTDPTFIYNGLRVRLMSTYVMQKLHGQYEGMSFLRWAYSIESYLALTIAF